MIRIEGLWKRYGLPLPAAYYGAARCLKKVFKPGFQQRAERWALKDINFEIHRGETFGIIGRNGAGKSTLLKVLAGVTPPTKGCAHINGTVFPMIELNAGLHMELTGRENVYLLGAIMGFSRADIRMKMPDIEEFCQLGPWIDEPVRKYSSGMLARLGFSVAAYSNTDILLVDEVLAVGDMAFQKRCYERIELLRSRGVTTVFVSHNIRQVERLCSRAAFLEDGSVFRCGAVVDVTNEYYEKSQTIALQAVSGTCPAIGRHAQGSGELVITDIQILNAAGEPAPVVATGQPMTVRLQFAATVEIPEPIISFALVTADMMVVSAVSNESLSRRPDFRGTGLYECVIPELLLLPGSYSLSVKCLYRHGALLLSCSEAAHFHVIPEQGRTSIVPCVGLVLHKTRWAEQTRPL